MEIHPNATLIGAVPPASIRDSGAGRRSVRTRRGEVWELALADVNANRIEAAYRRTDLFERRRALMEQWASFLAGAVDSRVRSTDSRGFGAPEHRPETNLSLRGSPESLSASRGESDRHKEHGHRDHHGDWQRQNCQRH